MSTTIGACSDPVDLGLHDGYAAIAGTLVEIDGTGISSVDIRLACGPTGPTFFGTSDRTNERGDFHIDAAAPEGAATTDVDSFILRCRISAVSGAEIIATRYAEVTFTRERDDRIVAVVDLTAGTIAPPPNGWVMP